MNDTAGTIERVALGLAESIGPLVDRLTRDEVLDLFAALGLRLPQDLLADTAFVAALDATRTAAHDVTGLVAPLAEAIESEDVAAIVELGARVAGDVASLVDSVDVLAARLRDRAGALPGVPPDAVLAFALELTARLVEMAVLDYVYAESSRILRFLALLGVVEIEDVPADPTDPTKPAYTSKRLRLDRIRAVLRAPTDLLQIVYGWGRPDFRAGVLIDRLAAFGVDLGVPIDYDPAATPPLLKTFLFGIRPTDGGSPPGIAVDLEIPLSSDAPVSLPLTERFSFEIDLRASLEAGTGIEVRPPFSLAFRPPSVPLTGTVALRFRGAPPAGADRLVLAGGAGGTRLETEQLVVAVELSFDWRATDGHAEADLAVSAQLSGGQLVVAVGEADSFLGSFLSGDLVLPASGRVVWSPLHGVQAGIEGFGRTFPLHNTIGPLSLETLWLALVPGANGFAFEAGVSGSAALGPVVAAIDRFGTRVAVGLEPGNFGPVDLNIGFKPPNGVGLAIDAGAVTGGGFLFHDEAKALYAGALHLEFEGISLNAIGLLTTRMPDGSRGFSLLVIVTASGFAPVQLGLGFTLTGVGGLLGLNRTAAVDVLRAGLKSHSLDAILFAQDDPTPRAAEIVSTLQSVFPPAPGRYLFGPMAQIGWGTPTLVTLELALLLELPAPLRLIVLGRLRAVLPDEQAAVVRISLDALGVVDFEARTAAVDATLYDSFVGPFALTGDMALRAAWGDRPAFALALGGFHPAFRPPEGFPALRRVTLTLSGGDNPRLRAELYLAVTSNTVQLGARLELHYEALGFALDGLFSFDALVNLAPFRFQVDVVAHLALLRGRTTLMGLDVRIQLSGPTPWRARGEAKFTVLFWDVTIPFDVTFGDERALPPPERVDVWPRLREAIRDGRNWSALLPEESGRVVSLGAPPPSAGEALVHPYGRVAFAQRLLPLERQLDLFGPAPPKDFGRFAIAGVASATVAGTRYDFFAPAQFMRMSDQEKLSRPSYERMPAGVELSGTGVGHGDEKPVPLSYETIVVTGDGAAPRPALAPALPPPRYVPTEAVVASQAEFGPAGDAPTRRTGRQAFRAPGDPAALAEPDYAVATRVGLDLVQTGASQDGSYSSALEALRAHAAEHPEAADDLQVVRRHETILTGAR